MLRARVVTAVVVVDVVKVDEREVVVEVDADDKDVLMLVVVREVVVDGEVLVNAAANRF